MTPLGAGVTGPSFSANSLALVVDSQPATGIEKIKSTDANPEPATSWKRKHKSDTNMKTAEWNTYRTRFLVKAKQLSCSLSFTDSLGRQHSGRKGDYLVESSDGVLRIAPRQIFEDIYVSMASGEGQPMVRSAVPVALRRKQPQSLRGRHIAPAQGAGLCWPVWVLPKSGQQ
jgi:hypothetical protein